MEKSLKHAIPFELCSNPIHVHGFILVIGPSGVQFGDLENLTTA